MAEFTIEAQTRTVKGKKVKRLRKEGLVPVSVYGPKMEPVALQVPYRPLEVALMNAGGTNLIDIIVEDGETYPVLARDVQRDVLKRQIQHVDFFAVDLEAKLIVSIPVHLVGESPAVAARKGILISGTNSVNIETLPTKIRNSIEVDLSQLVEVGDAITVGDLNFAEGVTVLDDPEELIARVSQTSAARAELLSSIAAGEGIEEGEQPEVAGEEEEEEEVVE